MNLITDLYKELNKNLSDINVSTLENTINHFLWFHNNQIEINHCKIDDVFNSSLNKKYYYIDFISFTHFGRVITRYKDNNYYSNTIRKLLKNKNFRLILMDVHETQEPSDIETFFSLFDKEESKKILFINNDSSLNNIKTNIKTLKTNFLVKNTTKGLSEIDFHLVWNKSKRDKLFLCLNKEGKAHRFYTLCLLEYYGLLDKTNYSFLTRPSTRNEAFKKSEFQNFGKHERKIDNLLRIPKISDYETKKDEFEDILGLFRNNYNFAGEVTYQDYRNTYINIITESVYFHKGIHITEKSLKPFMLPQLPLFVASPNHVETLRKDYKLDLFDDFINHDYDKETDDTKRLNMIALECLRLSKLENEIIDFYKNNIDRFKKNRETLIRFSKENEFNIIEDILSF